MNNGPTTRSLIAITAILGVLILTVQCHPGGSKTFRIGYLGSMTGIFATPGTSGRNGAVLAVEEINAAGGVQGHPVELVIMDDESQDEKAVDAVHRLADTGIRFIIGPLTTRACEKILPIINKGEILTISPTAAGGNLEDLDDFLLRLSTSTHAIGAAIVDFLYDNGFTRPGFIGDKANATYCATFRAGYNSAVHRLNNEVPMPVEFDSSVETSLTAIASVAVNNGIDSVLLCTRATDAGLLSQHLKRLSPDLLLVSAPMGISEDLIANGGEAVEGLYFIMPFPYEAPSGGPDHVPFRQKYFRRFKQEPTFAAISNYEAVMLLTGAVRAANTRDPSRIRRWILEKGLFKGTSAEFRFDHEGDPVGPLYLHRVEKGLFRTVATLDPDGPGPCSGEPCSTGGSR